MAKEVTEILLEIKVFFRYLTVCGISISTLLTLLLVSKGDLQIFMNRTFLDVDGLEKPYKRFSVISGIGLGTLVDYLLRRFLLLST